MYEIIKLSNGIRAGLDKMEGRNSFSFGVYVGCGSRYENEATNGIAHFIEHMVFKGTDLRDAAAIAYDIDEIGGQLNAYTSKEYTCFYFKVLAEHFERGIAILADMLLNSRFEENDITRERTVIDEEISVYEDSPDELVFDKLYNAVWGGKGLGLDILGTHESIKSFDREKLLSHIGKYYRTDNIVISAAGNFDRKRLTEVLEKFFGGLEPVSYRPVFERNVYRAERSTVRKDIEQLHMCMAFPCRRLGDDRYKLSVLDSAVGGQMSSRLFQKIREERGLCYSIYSTYSTYADMGLFMIYCALAPSNFYEAFKICKEELSSVRRDGITERELSKIKGQIRSGFLLGDENTASRSSRNGRNLLLRGVCPTAEENMKLLENIAPEELKELAEEILNFDNMGLSLVGNLGDIKLENI